MVTQYQASDLVICRAGASTIAELAVCGKGAILIPYPFAAHQHQLINARRLVDLGAARMIEDKELTGQSLAQAILHLYSHPEELRRMEEAIRAGGSAKGSPGNCRPLLCAHRRAIRSRSKAPGELRSMK